MIEVRPYPLMSPYGVARGQWVNQSRVDFQKPLRMPLIILIRLIIHVEVIKTSSPMYSFTLFNQSRVDFQKALKTPLIIPIRLIIHVEVIKTPSPMYSFTLFNSLAPERIVK